MKTKYFEITCTKCGSKNVQLWDWHNKDDSGMKLKCNDCKAEEKI